MASYAPCLWRSSEIPGSIRRTSVIRANTLWRRCPSTRPPGAVRGPMTLPRLSSQEQRAIIMRAVAGSVRWHARRLGYPSQSSSRPRSSPYRAAASCLIRRSHTSRCVLSGAVPSGMLKPTSQLAQTQSRLRCCLQDQSTSHQDERGVNFYPPRWGVDSFTGFLTWHTSSPSIETPRPSSQTAPPPALPR